MFFLKWRQALALSCSSFTPAPTDKLLRSSLYPPSTLSFLHKPPHIFDGSTGKETEVIDEPFFLDLVGEESDEYWFVGLLIKFLHSIFKKVSQRANKASHLFYLLQYRST
ncbi:hypothetical protein QQP08_006876, partial [Theobroma cacao]